MTTHTASPPTPAWRQLALVTALVVLAHAALLVSLPYWGIPEQPLPLESRFLTRTIVLAPPAAPAPASPPPAVKRPAAKPAPAATPRRATAPRPAPPPAEPSPAPVLSSRDDTAEQARAAAEREQPLDGESAAVQASGIVAGDQGPGGGGPGAIGEGELSGAGQPVQVHASARLSFEMLGQRGVQPWKGVFGELIWLQDGNEYNARLSLKMLFKTIRSQTSVGRIDANGIAPSRFSETRSSEVASHLVREENKVVFSNNAPSVPLLPGAQDRLSVVMQLGALLAANPQRYPEGSRIGIQTVGPKDAGVWTFVVEGSERISVPAGEFQVRRLSRDPRSEYDYKLELWLAPELGWLPARMRQTQQQGDVIDLQLREVSPP
ncbi:MAG TPA: DUF3108 domain-containing protein [Variovorax sp.]|nr:DUF3108 domain-containing protein [Variovorax sp.]